MGHSSNAAIGALSVSLPIFRVNPLNDSVLLSRGNILHYRLEFCLFASREMGARIDSSRFGFQGTIDFLEANCVPHFRSRVFQFHSIITPFQPFCPELDAL